MFIVVMIAGFVAGVSMLQSGGDPLLADVFVCLAIALAAEIYKPEKSTARLASWAKANLKWLCPMVFFL